MEFKEIALGKQCRYAFTRKYFRKKKVNIKLIKDHKQPCSASAQTPGEEAGQWKIKNENVMYEGFVKKLANTVNYETFSTTRFTLREYPLIVRRSI